MTHEPELEPLTPAAQPEPAPLRRHLWARKEVLFGLAVLAIVIALFTLVAPHREGLDSVVDGPRVGSMPMPKPPGETMSNGSR